MTQEIPDSLRPDEGEPDDLFYLSAGPLAALVLGMALVPLRGFTVASNFTFIFVVLTILVAEFGGRRAALATAVVSTLSLDFFLTEPYLKLTIASKNDVIAFCGLAICGVLAATLSSRRERNREDLRIARAHLDLLHESVRAMGETGSGEVGVEHLIEAFRAVAQLSAVAVRDANGRLLASSGDGAARNIPQEVLKPGDLLYLPPVGLPRPLAPDGNRIPLTSGTRLVGSLDVWGRDEPLSLGARRLLGDWAILVGAQLGRESGHEAGATGTVSTS